MIEALKSDELADKVGGRFKLCILIQRRLQELMDGSRPMVDRVGRTDLEIVFEEIEEDKIELITEKKDGETPSLDAGRPLLT